MGRPARRRRLALRFLPKIEAVLLKTLVPVVRRAQTRVRRQVTSRKMVASGSRRGDQRVTLRIGRQPVRARVDRTLRLVDQQAHGADLVRALLTRADVDFWALSALGRTRVGFGVRATDLETIRAALAGDPELSHWYRDRLSRRGRAQLDYAHAGDPLAPGVAAIVLWEFVLGDVGSTFAATSLQGVELQFWREAVPVDTSDEAVGAEASGDGTEPLESSEDEAPDAGSTLESVVATTLISPVPSQTLTVIADDEATGLRGTLPAGVAHRNLLEVGFPVDAVYTWVDGADEAWLAHKLEAAGLPSDRVQTERAHDESRFADHDELRYSLRSLDQFAPWVNHVWIVTSGQRPSWLADHPRVTVVSHRDIWPDDVGLPTFNSHAIESCLHRIEGLSEHFLYLNDDMIMGRPVKPENFFHGNGLSKFFWSRALVDHLPTYPGEIASTSAAKNARRLVLERCGVTFSRKFFHAPYPLRRSILVELESEFAETFRATREAVFRTTDDVAAAGSLYFNYAYATARAVPSSIRYEYIDPATSQGHRIMDRLQRSRRYETFCINDGSTEQTVEERQESDRLIRSFLQAYLPVPSVFEKPVPSVVESGAPTRTD